MRGAVRGLLSLLLSLLFCSVRASAQTFTVTNSNYNGTGSFSQAILDANAAGGVNNIVWSGTGGDMWNYENHTVLSDLVIDGRSATPYLSFSSNPTFDIGAGSTILTNLTLGSGFFQKTGAGTLLSCVPTGNLQMDIEGGTLGICDDANLGNPASALLLHGGTVRALNDLTIARNISVSNGGINTGDFNVTLTGQFSGGRLVKTGAGTLFMNEAVVGDFGGQVEIDEGTVAGDATTLHSMNITNNASLIINQGQDSAFYSILDGSGHLEKKGAGMLTLTGKSTYTGGTVVSEGILKGNTNSLFGDIANNTEVIFGRTNTNYDATAGTYAGRMSGPGSLLVTDGFNLTMTGENSYTGGTVVDNGSLAGTTKALQGDIVSNGQITFDQSFAGAYSGNLSGPASLYVQGGGTVTLSGVNSYTGITTVNYADLIVGNDNALGHGDLWIRGGELDLAGHNAQVGSIRSDDFIDLRNGTLRGTDFNGFGAIGIGIAGATSYGKLVIAGPAFLTYTGLKLSLMNGYLPRTNHETYRIVEANQVIGTFEDLEEPAALQFDVSYSSTAVDLTVNYVPFANSALNQNQSGIAAALDDIRVNNPGAMSEELSYLDSLDASHLQTAFDQMGPLSLTSLSTLGFADASSEFAATRRRFEGLRQESSPGHVALYDSRGKDPVVAVLASAGADLNPWRAPDPSNGPWSFFGAADGSFGRVGAMTADGGAQPGYDFSTGGLTVGADRRVSDPFTLGISGGFQSGTTRLDFDEGSADVKSLQLGLYGMHYDEHRVFLNGYVGGSHNSYETRRNIPVFGRTAKGSPDGFGVNGLFEVGMDRSVGKMTATPSVGLEYARLRINSFEESGAGNLDLKVGAQTVESLRSIVGGRLSRDFGHGGVIWSPRARLGWAHEFENGQRAIDAQFMAGGSAFSTQTASPGRDAALVGVGIESRLTSRLSAHLDYEAEVARRDATSQDLSGALRWNF